ncbi:MAG: tetratricopeptide repeat protein [Pirellulales bacterium]
MKDVGGTRFGESTIGLQTAMSHFVNKLFCGLFLLGCVVFVLGATNAHELDDAPVKPDQTVEPDGASVEPDDASVEPDDASVAPDDAVEPDIATDTPVDATDLFYAGSYAEAEESYRLLTESEDSDAVASRSALGIADCQIAVGKYDEARKTLTAAAAPLSKDARIRGSLANLALLTGDLAAAKKWSDAAMQLNVDEPAARWVVAELHRLHGRLDDANKAYEWFVDFYNRTDKFADPHTLRYVGLGAAQFARWNRLHDQFNFLVNQLYPDALALRKDFWPARLESGRLFLEKYNQADAAVDFEAALKINPNAAEVHAAVAELALQNYELEKAKTSIERALEINPHLLEAQLLKADIEFANFEPAAAEKILDGAAKLNPHSEPMLGRLAAARGCVDGLRKDPVGTRMGEIYQQVFQRNPHPGEFLESLADSLDTMRRYPESAHFFSEAIRVMPQSVGGYGKLALVHMRLGEEDRARTLLEKAFEVDFGNVRVKNSLEVLEVLDTYETLETEHYLIRFDPKHDKILARYVANYLEEIHPQLCALMGFEPPEKSLFEIFNKAKNTGGHGWFSARMVGLPHIHTIGACAGKMVAMVSPGDMKKEFNWARVVKHEFVHVINLQQTNFRIPHWFTEALAVYNEGFPRPPEWNEMLVRRVPAGKTFDLQTINLGFIRPSSSDDWQMAYCQAELYAEYVVEKFGEDKLSKLLEAYGDNLGTPEAIQTALKVSLEEFEQGYKEHVEKIVDSLTVGAPEQKLSFTELTKALEQKPEDPDLLGQMAIAFLRRKAYPKAGDLANKVLEAHPGHQAGIYVKARLRLVIGDTTDVVDMLEAALDRDEPHPKLLQLLAGLMYTAEEYGEAAELYELGQRKFPWDVTWTKLLARLHLKTDDEEKLLPLLVEMAMLDADDLVTRKKLAQVSLANKEYIVAQRWATEGIHIDVLDVELHRMLAESLAAQKKYDESIEEYDVAIEMEQRQLHLRFALADICVQAGKKDRARQVLVKLLELDPEYPGADVLLESLDK